MGTDIDLYAEILTDGGVWRPIPEPAKNPRTRKIEPVQPLDFGRPRNLISVLSGTKAGMQTRMAASPIPYISEPRGLPKDLNPLLRKYIAKDYQEEYGYWGFTWLRLDEIFNFDWYGLRILERGFVKPQYADLFDTERSFPSAYPEDEKVYHDLYLQPPEDVVEVYWSTCLAEFVGCLEWFFRGLEPLGPPDKVRVVYFFNS